MTYDVAVIGAGVVGAAIARELSEYKLDVVLVDAAEDVGTGTSKANTAILHTGFDATPGTLESRLVRRGYTRMRSYAKDAGIPVELTGALLVAWTAEQLANLPGLKAKAAENGVTDLLDVSVETLYRIEPRLGPGALGALAIPGEGIICPYTPPLAFATEAVLNGVELKLSRPVTSVRRGDTQWLHTPDGDLAARFVVNAAGLGSDVVDRMFGFSRFTIRPRRGELIVYDKLARSLLTHVLLPVPTKTTKGVLVAPTVFGNVLLGPTAEDLDDRDDRSTTERGLGSLLDKGRAILPDLLEEEVTATYAGLRAATEHSDYQIHLDGPGRYVCVGGIRSTGLSASMAIAEYVVELLAKAGLALERQRDRVQMRMPYIGSTEPRPHEEAARIERGPDYGRIVCHCERVSLGEIRDAMTSPVPARSLDAVRRRTRCLQGRCQGFYCLARVASLVADGTGTSVEAALGLEPEDGG
jgi:glycerol-3-phosphate dehydrogenase